MHPEAAARIVCKREEERNNESRSRAQGAERIAKWRRDRAERELRFRVRSRVAGSASDHIIQDYRLRQSSFVPVAYPVLSSKHR